LDRAAGARKKVKRNNMKKSLLILLLFLLTSCLSYYFAFTTYFEGEGGLKALGTVFLALQTSVITVFLLFATIFTMNKINLDQFSVAGFVFSLLAIGITIYFWRANGYVEPGMIMRDETSIPEGFDPNELMTQRVNAHLANPPGNYNVYLPVFLPPIVFAVVSQWLSYFYFNKQKASVLPS
jgi:hypothetical protein